MNAAPKDNPTAHRPSVREPIAQAGGEMLAPLPGRVSPDAPDVMNMALPATAAPDQFRVWWMGTKDTLPNDFDLAV
ncbi:MAG TPA: hypothetical protein VIG49_04405 [Acetobacteraceae bacterium]